MRLFLRIVSIFGFLLIPFLVLAQSQPGGIPHQFYGLVNFSNGPAPDGVIVEAKIDGVTVATTNTSQQGKYGYSPLFFVTDPDNNRKGKTITFFVGGIDTGKSATFVNGEHTKIDFVIPLNIGTITATTQETITNQPVLVTPTNPTVIQFGNVLNITISSTTNATATIEKIQKLSSDFVSTSYGILSGTNLLNAFEIKITGNVSIEVTMSYDETGIDEGTIVPYRFDGSSWVAIEPFSQDPTLNKITFNISSAATPYAVFGSPSPTGGGVTGGGVTGGGGGGGGGGAADTTPPSISEISVVPGIYRATITWKTDKPSISWVAYGTTTDYGKEIKTTSYTTSHSLILINLSPATLYHYQIKSRDSAGNTGSSSDRTFTTLAKPVKGDINNDNKVDKYDFALMMANWGKIGVNASDLNGDSKVDKYDFAILMANWSIV
jgi:hypothetical protein